MKLSKLLAWAHVAASRAYTLPLNCAANGGIMTTPTYGTTGAMFTVCVQNTINSLPSAIYEVLLVFPEYPAWNTFVYAVDLPAGVTSAADVYVDMPMTFNTSGLLPPLNTTSDELITYLEPDNVPPFVGWRENGGTIGDLLMQAEHISVLNDLGDRTTEYVSWETYYGLGAVTVASLSANLHTEFQDQAVELQARVEGMGA